MAAVTYAAIIQARYNSTRLPGKVVLPLAGRPVLAHIVERAWRIPGVDTVAVTVPDGSNQGPLVELVGSLEGVRLSRGPEEDLARRYRIAAGECGATTVVRLWADCPVLDPALAGALLAAARGAGVPFATIPLDSGYPEGVEAHVMTIEALAAADTEAIAADERETIHLFFSRRPERFPVLHFRRQPDRHALKVLLDTPDDYRRLKQAFDILYPENPLFGVAEVEALAVRRPELFTRPAT
ncbi:MAG: NTP transferase domain-containing protein [Rhodospirillales bacterium]|nr:NTP transferase domain-containing protein [Rhodospirillales bacterium]